MRRGAAARISTARTKRSKDRGAHGERTVMRALATLCLRLTLGGGAGVSTADRRDGLLPAVAPTTASTPLRRLTRREYDNTVRDLLGDTRGLAGRFASDGIGPGGFTT